MKQAVWALLAVCSMALGQVGSFHTIDSLPLKSNGMVLRQHVEAGMPFTVAGERGVLVGDQKGTFEAWVLPVKLFNDFSITAHLAGYDVPIDLNRDAAEIEVYPDRTVITYAHIGFRVRQIMFAPDGVEDGTGAVVLFQINSTKPLDLTFNMKPQMRPMWPQPTEGTPSPDWVKLGASGYYVLHMDFPNLAGAIAMPGAQPGILAPYEEKPTYYPLQLKLHYDPQRDGAKYFPLLMAVGMTDKTATNIALRDELMQLNDELPQIYAAHAASYAKMQRELTSIETPDKDLNRDFAWAETAVEQLKVKLHTTGETALVAGYFSSGDSARPGYGWCFGRDSLYTLYAIDSFGDFKLSREELEFLIKRQRDDGKIMHEYSQTAALVDWKSLPYMYAAADSTPLFLTAMLNYVRSSGDVAFLKENREAVEKAWHFETTHDTDGDGIYDNSQGTGWVESWPGGMPHQEIYLAELDREASSAMAELDKVLGNEAEANAAAQRAAELSKKIEEEYYIPAQQRYAFSWNGNGKRDEASTMFPAIAWWNDNDGLEHAGPSFRLWASHDFSTDWGLRDVAASDPKYNPISYHQGSVWPVFTGWMAVAEYRTGHALSGYAHLMQNADMTTTQDLGAVTELLSGDYFIPFGRSTTHQLWSSAMVITPTLTGLFGIEADGLTGTIKLDPHLPADWNEADVKRVHVGNSVCTLHFERRGQSLIARVTTSEGKPVRLVSDVKGVHMKDKGDAIAFPLPAVEVAIPHGLPLPGARTRQMKVLDETFTAHSLTLDLEADAGTVVTLKVRRNTAKVKLTADGGTLAPDDTVSWLDSLQVEFPAGSGYVQKTVVLRW
jgi:Mannosylglycerate hydrolase MGH1-like glycoside hydrolase domain